MKSRGSISSPQDGSAARPSGWTKNFQLRLALAAKLWQ
ncbi:hypothetical protein SJ05684_c02020 [Sinorhizobium sojae CCBAU 05684]|uniref:Uncharacterized protein n=1 Tax=Sinorhizobium sojae CCBAU 05684 TaxID=716928 RepID=A0A249P6U8_9HYPH|nr:hypothetical protein SJ05684_c02020 [Sinorhizobium sojae CCBAU 05684]